MTAAEETVVLDFADEKSVVQTRFPTTVIAMLRAHPGEDLASAIARAARTGGLWVASGLDPMAEPVRAQRLAVAIAEARGPDPDSPRNLTRSIVLDRV